MSSNQRNVTGSLEDLVTRLLDRGFTSAASRVLGAVNSSITSGPVARDIELMNERAAELSERGERLTADDPTVRAVLGSLDLAMRDNIVRLRDASGSIIETGVTAGNTLARQLALPGLSNEQLEAVGLRWNQVPPDTILNVIDLVDNPAFSAELQGLADNVVESVRNQAIRGVVFGWSPLRTAREIARVAESYTQAQATTLMRTLQLESYRTSTTANYQVNSSIIRRVIRVEVLDKRICAACIALHGTVIWDSETDQGTPIPKIREHHNGRGTTIPETVIRPINVQSGPEWFNGLDESEQRALIGGAAVNALQSGEVRLSDFVGERTDNLYGEMIYEQSVKGILGERASEFYQRNQS